MKYVTSISTLVFLSFITYSQNFEINWKYKATDMILASPIVYNNTIYIGDEKGVFHAIDSRTGTLKWKLETKGNIQAKATMIGSNVFFESANKFYLVEGADGNELWHYDLNIDPFVFTYKNQSWNYKIDPYDDKRSGAVLYKDQIFVGTGNGKVLVLNEDDGSLIKSFKSDNNVPVRSTPLIFENKLFFGDWEGIVYCFDLDTNDLIWKKKTYRGEKPYGTFGGVVSEFAVYKGLIYFGARNYTLNVLDLETGEREWTYTDPNKGWIIGDPVIHSDTLYIGGSDNYSMYAFHPTIGYPFWSQNGGKNIYTKPLATQNHIIYTSGNGYDANDSGKLFVLDRYTGKELLTFETNQGIFSSPVLTGDQIVFGCYDGNVYSLSFKN